MKNVNLLFAICLLFSGCYVRNAENVSPQPVGLILDTDMGPDYDDVGAMALLHSLADSAQVHILATLSSNCYEQTVPCIEVLNTYFGRADIPVGAPKGENSVSLTTWHRTKWTEMLPSRYAHRTRRTSEAPDAVKVYRKILSESADSSVVICSIGFFTNLRDLLVSPPDEYSACSGRELVSRKIKRLVSMAGKFPEGREFNIHTDAPAAGKVIEEWPVEIVFSGFEIGERILTGKDVVSAPGENNPVKEAYRLCMAEGDSEGRMSWDQTAVWVAVKGYEPYFTAERGICHVNEDGSNSWEADPAGKHVRLIEKTDPAVMGKVIEKYMLHRPVKTGI